MPRNKSEKQSPPSTRLIDILSPPLDLMKVYGFQTDQHFITVWEHPDGHLQIEMQRKDQPEAPVQLVVNGVTAILGPTSSRY